MRGCYFIMWGCWFVIISSYTFICIDGLTLIDVITFLSTGLLSLVLVIDFMLTSGKFVIMDCYFVFYFMEVILVIICVN